MYCSYTCIPTIHMIQCPFKLQILRSKRLHIMPINITGLAGDALFEALTSGDMIEIDQPSKASKPAEILKSLFKEVWTKEAVILIEHIMTCNCGYFYPVPNKYLMLKETNDKKGTHIRPLLPEESHIRKELPVEYERTYDTCAACLICCPPTEPEPSHESK